MQDELRATWLAAALEGDEPPEIIDDEELAALVSLGAALRRAGPDLAAISRADTAFSPAFGHGLAEQLRVAHPAATTQEARPAPLPLRVRGRRVIRSLIALVVLVLAVAAILVLTLARGFQPGVQTGSAASPTARSGQARPRAMQAISVHPPVVASAPHGTHLPSTPAPSAGAGAQPSAPANSGFAPIAPRIQAQAGIPLTYKLPPSPSLPARLPIFRVRATPLSATDATRIAAHFPGLHAVNGPAGSRDFGGQGGHLEIMLATGEVRYVATAPGGTAHPGAMTRDAAIAAARAWLVAHGLYPTGVDQATSTVTAIGRLTRVSFAPHTPLPLTGSAAIGVRVDLDPEGHVITARRFWPTLTVASMAGVRSPAVAVAARRAHQAPASDHAAPQRPAPPASVFRVERIVPSYALSADGAQLVPVYVLSGVLSTAAGTSTPTVEVLPATNQ